MSRRNAKKLQRSQAAQQVSDDEEEEPVRSSLFTAAQHSDDSESPSEEDAPSTTHSLPPTDVASPPPVPTDTLEDILESLGVSDTPLPTPTERTESVLRRQAKHFNHFSELAKRFKTPPPGRIQLSKRTLLTPGVPAQWPRLLDYSLTMVKLSDLCVPFRPLFSLEASKGYRKTQSEYESCVHSFEPTAISLFLQAHPFHIEALYQMTTFYHLQSNYEQMELLLQRLLYVFQISFHQEFSVLRTDVRVDIGTTAYNRLFYQSMELYIEILGRKGCSRTALELAKVVLGLSPTNDPVGALFLVEYYSLRCKKWEYFLRFARNFMQEFHGRGSLLMFPNILYSVALVKALQSPPEPFSPLHIQKISELQGLEAAIDLDPSSLLLLGVGLYPAVANCLMQKLSKTYSDIETDGETPLGNIGKIAEIYAERCSELWKNEAVAGWLKQACEWEGEAAQVQLRIFNSFPPLMSFDRYSKLDKSHFSDAVRTVIPRDMFR